MKKILIVYFLICFLFFSFNFFPLTVFSKENDIKDSLSIIVKYKDSRFEKVVVPKNISLDDFLQSYQSREDVEYVEKNISVKVSAAVIPTDTYFKDKQKYLSEIKVPEAWSVEVGKKEVIVAVIDTGVDINHPDLRGNIWVNMDETNKDNLDNDNNGYIDDINGWDFVLRSSSPAPKPDSIFPDTTPQYTVGVNHGTVIAGLIAAVGNNKQGISGVSWKTKIMPLRVLNNDGYGEMYDVIRSINYAIDNNADIINLSFVGLGTSRGLVDVLNKAYERNMIIVVAGGNATYSEDGDDLDMLPEYPVCVEEKDKNNIVLGVASINSENKKSGFSNFGKNCIDLAAPGESLFSTQTIAKNYGLTEAYGSGWSGTSFAAPLVSGVASLVKAVNPYLSNEQIYKLMISNSESIDKYNDPKYKGKIGKKIDAYKIVSVAKNTLGQPKNGQSDWFNTPQIVVFSQNKKDDYLKLFNKDLALVGVIDSHIFSKAMKITGKDLDGDGETELVLFGQGKIVFLLKLNGTIIASFEAFADDNLVKNVNVSLGDIDGDDKNEIICSSQDKALAKIEIYNYLGKKSSDFLVYPNLKLGLNIAVGDIDNNNIDEIIVGAGAGGGPQVTVYNRRGGLIKQFFVADQSIRSGVKVNTADIDSDGYYEIITTIKNTFGQEELSIFDNKDKLKGKIILADSKDNFVNYSIGDYNYDHVPEILKNYRDSSGIRGVIINFEGVIINDLWPSALGVFGVNPFYIID